MVERFDDFVAGGGYEERLVKLGKVAEGDGNIELAQPVGAEAEFASANRVVLQFALGLNMPEVSTNGSDKLRVFCAGGEVHPNFVVVHIGILRYR